MDIRFLLRHQSLEAVRELISAEMREAKAVVPWVLDIGLFVKLFVTLQF